MTAETWHVSAAEYHADWSWISHSQAELIREDPAIYDLARRGLWSRKPTPSMRFGTLLHEVVLRPDPGDHHIVVIPSGVLAKDGSRRGKRWDAFAREHGECLLATAGERETVCRILESIDRHASARTLLDEEGEYEEAIRFEWPGLHVRCKCKPDKRTPRWIVDLKTSVSVKADKFAGFVARFGYHRQAAFYQVGVQQLVGGEPLPFVFLAVQTEAPWSVETYDLTDLPEFRGDLTFLEMGRTETEEDLLRYRQCSLDDKWTSPTHGQIVTLAPPAWALYRKEWDYDDGG